ncbi:MAG: Stearoyl-CoA 9-desaturase [Actinomycetia bacterium]|nr:Stearoyl-CoA 9-desaturase [Actinomycetes bacterium]
MRDWPAVLSLGFCIDGNGRRRKPVGVSIVILGILLPGFAMWGLYRAFTTPTGVGLWALAAVLYLFTMFGVTLGNHRYWTHRGFEARFPLKVVLAVASGMSMEGSIQQWVMNHRAHHRFADVVDKDPHSPYEYTGWQGYKGLVWAQGVWLLFAYERPPGYALHRDLAEDRLLQWQQRAFPFLVAASFLVPLAFYPLFGWNAVLIAGALRAEALMTATGFVNSVCHKWGSRATDSCGHEFRADDSRNNPFVAVVAGGEGNHNWHHADPACPRHGRKVTLDAAAVAAGARPDRGWRPDATWRLIQLLALLGLVYKVKTPKAQVYFAEKQLVPNPSLRETHRERHVSEPREPQELVAS